MPGSPNKLSQFWQELKRRRFIHVITVYASAAFVFIELINNLAEPLNLPPNLLIIVVIVLAVGFPLAIMLSWLYDVTSEGVEKTKPIEEVTEKEKTVIPNAWKIATYVSFVIIIGLLTFNIIGGSKQLHAGDIQSLVILPFSNFTGDDQLEYFVSGMHSSMVGGIGQVSGLRVVSETSANAYKDADKPLVAITRELGVDAALESSVMCLGDTICLQVKLISTVQEEKQLWVGNFREEKGQIMGLLHQIAREIADETKIKLTPEELEQLIKVRQHRPDLLEACFKGRFYMNQLTEEGVELGIRFYNDAIAIDSTDPLPYLGLALGYSLTGHLSGVVPDAAERAIDYAHKALALDSTLAEAYVVLAWWPLYKDWDFEAAERYLLRALELNQNIAIAHYHLGWFKMLSDDVEGADAEFRIAMEIDPLNVIHPSSLAGIYGWTGQHEKALELGKRFAPEDLRIQSHAFSGLGMHEEAIATMERVLAIAPGPGTERNFAIVYARAGQRDKAIEIVDTLISYNYSFYFWNIATIYAALGDYDEAIHWLEECYNVRHAYFPFTKYNGLFQPLYDDPRFVEIFERLDYPE